MILRRLITDPLKRAVLASGHYHRVLRHARFPGVAVLAYHAIRARADVVMPFAQLHVTVDELEQHCRFLRETCDPIRLDEWPLAKRPEVARPVLVTFDDGYASVAELAMPVLERYGIPAVLFAATDAVAQGRRFWFDAVARAEGEGAVTALSHQADTVWRAHAARAADAVLGHGDPTAPMTPEVLRTLPAHGMTLGSHTASHAVLSGCTPSTQRDEVQRAIAQLHTWTGVAPTTFAYPVGGAASYDAAVALPLLREAGIVSAFTTREAFALGGSAQLELPRFVMLHSYGAAELAHRLAYAWPR